MKIELPNRRKHSNLTVRADQPFLERLDALLSSYKRRWPTDAPHMSRSWLVTELLNAAMTDAEVELEERK